ncbi:hypothetical protein DPSP01_013742 [Paraphaeosphaeria sporulosa]
MSSRAPGISGRKVAIPRLQRLNLSQSSMKRERVGRACTACRSRKIKCTGDVPQCKRCGSTGRECVYVMPRKDRLKTVTERSGQMIGLLKKLHGFANDEDSAHISKLLEAAEEDMLEAHTPTTSTSDTYDDDLHRPKGMFDTNMSEPLERMSIESLDLVGEKLHETDQARATEGFLGPNSEVQWLRSFLRLEQGDSDVAISEQGSVANTAKNEGMNVVTFYLERKSIDSEIYVDPYELPTADVAKQLLHIYMEKVHDSFPILPRKLFQDQCQSYFEALRHGLAPKASSKWQAILNLVFAVSSKYSHLIKACWQGDERDHLIYQARASALAWKETTFGQHPDLPQVQVAGLLAFYHLSVGQVNRAWVVMGLALRFAIALGLHVRIEDPSASRAKREALVRVWWSLYYLERQLTIITGRPSMVIDSCCSVPLPVPLSERQISEDINIVHSGSYFRAVVQLSIISQSILTSLYSAGSTIRSLADLQKDAVQIGTRIDDWAVKLPINLYFQAPANNVATSDKVAFRQRTMLAFQFWSAKILLTHPFLNAMGELNEEHQDQAPLSYSIRMAGICVESAKMKMDLLPDQPQPSFVYEFGPWWIAVHHLMQALAVFLLALSYSPAMQQDNVILAGYCIKIIRWLHVMEDSQAERARHMAVTCYEVVAFRLSLPGLNMWTSNQIPDSGIKQDDAPQATFPVYHHPTAAQIGYGSDIAMTTYSALVADSAPSLYAPNGFALPYSG